MLNVWPRVRQLFPQRFSDETIVGSQLPLPGVLREKKAAIEDKGYGEHSEGSREQHRSRAKRLLQLLAGAGWTVR